MAHGMLIASTRQRTPRRAAFSLVELLTVIFIISLLIAILIPSLGAARSQAKKVQTTNDLKAIGASLELFRNDNERDFPHTNGYPPSGAHPRIRSASGMDTFDPALREFPFLKDTANPAVTGAHWLPAMLMGVDGLGYIQKKLVPSELRGRPDRWYRDPGGQNVEDELIPRTTPYLTPGDLKTVTTKNIRGRKSDVALFGGDSDWEDLQDLPVFVDRFDQPILYYVANKHGRTTNMLGEERTPDNRYTGGDQEVGPPYYFHADNQGFTGTKDLRMGWNLGGGEEHPIGISGAMLTPAQLVDPDDGEGEQRGSFARFILDRGLRKRFESKFETDEQLPPGAAPLRPVNEDSYLLITAGVDGLYGTADDITNFSLATD